MDSLSKKLAELNEYLTPEWGVARQDAAFRQIRRKQAVRKVQIRATTGALSMAAVALLWFSIQPSTNPAAGGLAHQDAPIVDQAVATHVAAAPDGHASEVNVHRTPGKTALADGSEVTSYEGAEFVLRKDLPEHISVELRSGRARFDVVPNRQRRFEVSAAEVVVTVLGTVFEVESGSDGVAVSVDRGRVQVTHEEKTVFLTPGESLLVKDDGSYVKTAAEPAPIPGPAAEPVTGSEREPSKNGTKTLPEQGRKVEAGAWRAASRLGHYEAAFKALQATGLSAAERHDPSVLMEAADAARFSGNPRAAVTYLAAVTRHHRNSAVAPLAAFTLGRVHLEQLGQPHQAAQAFALSRKLAPEESLAQDALAREVEALSKGAQEEQAYRKALEYQRHYPNGARIRAVRMYGGLK